MNTRHLIILLILLCSTLTYASPDIISDDINDVVTNDDFSIFEFAGSYDTKRNNSKITFRLTHKGVLSNVMNIESSYRHNQDVEIKSKVKEVIFNRPVRIVTIDNFDISKSPIGEYGSCGFRLGLTLNKSKLQRFFILIKDDAVWKSNTATPGVGVGCLNLKINASFVWYDSLEGFYQSMQEWKYTMKAEVVSSNNLFEAKYLIVGTKKFDLKKTCYISISSGNIYSINMLPQNDWLMTNIMDDKNVPIAFEYEDGRILTMIVPCDYKRKFKALSF